jgi:hypothetical protein
MGKSALLNPQALLHLATFTFTFSSGMLPKYVGVAVSGGGVQRVGGGRRPTVRSGDELHNKPVCISALECEAKRHGIVYSGISVDRQPFQSHFFSFMGLKSVLLMGLVLRAAHRAVADCADCILPDRSLAPCAPGNEVCPEM